MKTGRTGFTLIEMLVVIAIIAILAAISIGGYSWAVRSAQRAKAAEAVSNAKTALVTLRNNLGNWPRAILEAGTHNNYFVMDEKVAKVLFKNGLLNVDCKEPEKESKKGDLDEYKLRGVDLCGIADPWAQAVLKKAGNGEAGNSLLSRPVSSGGKVEDHLIYFAVDQDDDGFVDRSEGAPVNKVRATAITWCAGPDGNLDSKDDNVYSWNRGTEER